MSKQDVLEHYEAFKGFRKANLIEINATDQSRIDIIPTQWRNNIRWHAGHIVTVQASLMHVRLHQASPINENWFKYFAKGTSPENFDDNLPAHETVIAAMNSSLEFTESRIDQLLPLLYDEPRTVTGGLVLKSFVDAVAFMPLHEAYHLGAIKGLKKLL